MRFLRELFDPAEKCARLGHKPAPFFRRGYVRANYGFHVVDGVIQTCERCLRCNKLLSKWTDVDGSRVGFSGYSWPSDQAAEFDKNGEYWTREGWSP